jgi:excinuclease ABC subunit C
VLPPLGFRQFEGFGASRLWPRLKTPTAAIAIPADARQRRQQIRQHCRSLPGVYGMLDAEGDLIYVGKSKSLRERLLGHCTASVSDSDSKSQRILQRTARLLWEVLPDEFAALLRELELIRRWRPRFNVQGQPDRLRRTYLCLGRGPAARAYLTSEPGERVDRLFGPLRGIGRWRASVRWLNDCFQLRDCPDRVPMVFSEQLQLFAQNSPPKCLRYDLGTCLAPCAGGCSSRQYAEHMRRAVEFLSGRDLSILVSLEQAMQQAAALRQFERAAALRDAWQALSTLGGHLEALREAQKHYSFIYPLAAASGGTRWYFLRHGRVVASTAGPRNRRTAGRCLRLLEQVYQSQPQETLPGAEDLDVLLLVTGWFHRHPDQLSRTLTPESARDGCRQKLAGIESPRISHPRG